MVRMIELKSFLDRKHPLADCVSIKTDTQLGSTGYEGIARFDQKNKNQTYFQ